MRLDFLATPSGSVPVIVGAQGRMQGESDTGALFAVLTGLLEDAAGLAAEGQNPGLTIRERRTLISRLRHLLNHAGLTLDELDAMFQTG